jgi:hypothetical protein
MTLQPKPCPFCGHVGVDIVEGSTFRWRKAVCQKCDASTGEIRRQTLGDGGNTAWERTAEVDCIKEWNTRYEEKK